MTGDYHEIGSLLKQARREFKLEVSQVAQALHIRPIYLEALEDGRFEALPGGAYARGYLLSYASFLQLDTGEILRRFDRTGEALANRGFFLPETMRHEKKPSPKLIWGGLLTALAIYCFWMLVTHPPRWPSFDWSTDTAPIIDGNPKNDACFKPRDVLYPPCHMTKPQFELLPLRRPKVSVMDVAR